MKSSEYILGMDIGGTNFRIGLVNKAYKACAVEIIPSAEITGKPDTAQAIADLIKAYCRRNLSDAMPLMAAAGFPSVVDRERKRLYSSTNFPGLDGVNIVDKLETALGIPVIIDHDAYYLLTCDIHKLGLKNEGTLLGFYFGTGMGNAMFLNGQPYIGKNGTACEVGHMPVGLSRRRCSCGNRGCVEMYCCGKALERLARERFPKTPLNNVFGSHANEPVFKKFVRYMAVPIATAVNLLDPDGVFIGGGLVHMEGFPKDMLIKAILENTRKPYPADNLQLYFSDGAPENGIIGAGIEGYRRLGRA